MIIKPDKYIVCKENQRLISLSNTDNNPNKIVANPVICKKDNVHEQEEFAQGILY